MSKPVVFYSSFCSFSEKFIIIIDKLKIDYIPICIDIKNGKRPEIVKKLKLKEVPSVMVDNKIISGKSAFSWLKSKASGKNTPSQAKSQKTQNYIEPWSSGDICGNSFVSNTSSFLSIGDTQNSKIFTIDDDEEAIRSKSGLNLMSDSLNCQEEEKMPSKSFDKEMNRYMEARNNI